MKELKQGIKFRVFNFRENVFSRVFNFVIFWKSRKLSPAKISNNKVNIEGINGQDNLSTVQFCTGHLVLAPDASPISISFRLQCCWQ